MLQSVVTGICIGAAKQPLRSVDAVTAISEQGLEGDRYSEGTGSWQKGALGKRQVTLIDAALLERFAWSLADTRRNIAIKGDIDLMRLFNYRERISIIIGDAVMRGVAYCDPCQVPTKLSKRDDLFRDTFRSCGGIITEVVKGGEIRVGDLVEVNLPPR